MGRLNAEQLSPLAMVARVVATALAMLTRTAGREREATRLRSILEISRRLAVETETQPLLETIAREATRLLDCDRASIFIWDRDQKQLIASPALGVSGGKLYLPDSRGIVGAVVQTGVIAQVDDAYSDPRFDQSVDRQSGYRTRNLLCVPLVNGSGQRIGAFELINRNQGDFTDDDQRTLADLGAQAAVAIENARRHDQLVRSNRQLTERVLRGVEIIGSSTAMNALRGTIDRLANTDLPVLILGESGTGKEVAAQSLHYRGPGPTSHSSRSTVLPSPKHSWKANSSGTRRAPSPMRTRCAKASSNSPRGNALSRRNWRHVAWRPGQTPSRSRAEGHHTRRRITDHSD